MPTDVFETHETLARPMRNRAPSTVRHDTRRCGIEHRLSLPMNEEITVGEFMEWVQGRHRAGAPVTAQILIVDSSTDNHARRLCLNHGGEVLRVPKSGESVARTWTHFRTFAEKWILMGERPTLTYDFSRNRSVRGGIPERRGVHHWGSRFSRQHRKKTRCRDCTVTFGTPLTNWILKPDLSQQLFRHPLRHTAGVTREAIGQNQHHVARAGNTPSEMVAEGRARLKLVSFGSADQIFTRIAKGRLSHHLPRRLAIAVARGLGPT